MVFVTSFPFSRTVTSLFTVVSRIGESAPAFAFAAVRPSATNHPPTRIAASTTPTIASLATPGVR